MSFALRPFLFLTKYSSKFESDGVETERGAFDEGKKGLNCKYKKIYGPKIEG